MIDMTVAGPVATITAAGFEPLGTHDLAFGAALRDAIRAMNDRDDVKAIVLQSSADDFSMEGGPAPSPGAAGDAWLAVYASASGLYQTLCFSRKVTITAVAGRCGPAGTLLALYSDITLAADDAVLFSPFATLPEASFVVAALTMGLNRAKAWSIAGAPLTAREACDAGLVTRVTSRADLAAAALQAAAECSRMPLDGLAMSKVAMEAFLDGQGVGEDFDLVPFYAAALPRDAA